MGVDKKLITNGDGATFAKAGDEITMQYTGYLVNPSASDGRGNRFDSSLQRGNGDFKARIGVGQVIRGWDDGVLKTDGGMSLGETSTLTISSDYAYGERGFTGHIPPNATLIFDVFLKAINGKTADKSRGFENQ